MHAFIYHVDSPHHVTCCLATGAVGSLYIPTSIDHLRHAHLFAPISVVLLPPITYNSAKATYACAGLEHEL